MAEVGEHVAIGAVAVLVPRALEDRGGDEQHRRVAGRAVFQRTGRQRLGRRRAEPLQRMRLRVVVQHSCGEAGQRPGEQVELGREQRARGRRGAQREAAAVLGDADGVPEQRAERRDIQAAGARRRRCRQRLARRARMALERRRRLAPAGGGRAGQQAGAGVRREGMEALDQRQRRRRVAAAGAGRRAPGRGRRAAGRGLDLELAAALTQPEHERRAGGREHAERRQQAAPRRARRGRTECRRRFAIALGAPGEPAPHGGEVEHQMQRHQQHRAVAEQVVPVEHRQLLVGDPEDAQAGGGRDVGEQEHARDDVDRGPRGRAAAQELQRQERGGEEQRQRDPENLRHRRDLQGRSSLGRLAPARHRAFATIGSVDHRSPSA